MNINSGHHWVRHVLSKQLPSDRNTKMKTKLTILFTLLSCSLAFGQFNQVGGESLKITAPGNVNLGDAAVTQITSTTTGVTMNSASGVITTFTEAGAAVTDAAFVLTDSAIVAGSAIQATVNNYSGTIITNGIPTVWVSGIAAGSCTVHVTNVHAVNALNGVVKIGITVN